MMIITQEFTLKLKARDIRVWMEALRIAANKAKGCMLPWDHCPFYNQHEELVKLTGWGEADHVALGQKLASKDEPARSGQESGRD